MKQYAARDRRGHSDMEQYREVCRIFETRKFCQVCYTNPTQQVRCGATVNATVQKSYIALCRVCADKRDKAKGDTLTTLAKMNQRLKELDLLKSF